MKGLCVGEWCAVGDASNPPLPDGRGRVDYPFEVAKTPVTNRLYCDFLNALPEGERDHVFTQSLTDHFFGGILRDGACSTPFRPKKGFENKPAVFVSWFDACKYADWLCDQDAEWEYRLPTADEWLKAAAFCFTRGWSKYLTGSDEIPSQDPAKKNSANYYDFRSGWALPTPHLADVNLYRHTGPYGTLGQAGNVGEWVDSETPSSWKLALGGSLFRPAESLLVTSTEGDAPEKRLSTFGFRLVRVRKDRGDRARNKAIAHDSGKKRGTAGTLNAQRSTLNVQVIDDASREKGMNGDYVEVGHPCNSPDRLFGGYGRVKYVFEIARHAVTNRDYATFLNAVACRDDPFGLFHKDMETGVLGGIRHTNKPGTWFYQAKSGWEEKPVVYIDYFSAARYANWLHYGCPVSGVPELGTTEGDAEQGAYDTRRFAANQAGDQRDRWRIGRRNPGARYWIPSNDEWYKAAYHDPEKTGTHKYWEFTTRSSNLPGLRDTAEGHAANYQRKDAFAVGTPYYLADVQAYEASASFYGTVQQGGNAWEWLEDFRYTRDGILCGLRGGSFGYTETGLHAGNEDWVRLGTRSYVFGLRMARTKNAAGWKAPKHSFLHAGARKLIRSLERLVDL